MTATKLISTVLLSILTGVAGTFITIVAVVAAAAMLRTPVGIPWVFSASVTTVNDLPAVEFTPNGAGLIALSAIIAAACTTAVVSVWSRTRR
ncbi:hypothetical protein [Curtobacterium sp. RRHDQ10]|uniref:hypothetical protein n=1 Tax=Curtobacterium phyllosphaerae TaxID=3413379 RepID=UPI003BF106AB